MTAVGMFAGRGDVVLAMLMALVFGGWLGWQAHRGFLWLQARRSKSRFAEPR